MEGKLSQPWKILTVGQVPDLPRLKTLKIQSFRHIKIRNGRSGTCPTGTLKDSGIRNF